MPLYQILIHVQRSSTILARRVIFLHLDVAQSAVREICGIVGVLDLLKEKDQLRFRHKLPHFHSNLCTKSKLNPSKIQLDLNV